LLAVLQERESRGHAYLTASAAQGLGVLNALLELIHANAAQPGLAQLFTIISAESISDEHPAHKWFADRYNRVVDHFRRELEAAQQAGQIRPDVDPVATAHWVVAMADGLRLQWLLNLDDVDHVMLLNEFLTLVRAHLTGVPASPGPREWTLGRSCCSSL
jgi:BetI-type transcriptional repressor, C-terminal